VKTRLGLPPEEAALLHERFVRATLETCLSLNAAVELHTDIETQAWTDIQVPRQLQREGNLGERMLAALESCPAPVMIVGSDAPTLPATHLESLLAANTDVALGPAEDGGYYAICCRRTHRRMFEGIEWSTNRTLQQTVTACRDCGLTVSLGDPWFDVDTPADLARLGSWI
jgi:rSAM/selenodomain-associated transferase 1